MQDVAAPVGDMEATGRIEAALREAQEATRLRDEALSVVAHDLRNSLGAITAYGSLLEEDAGCETQREYARSLLRVSGQMDALIQDLLTASRLERGSLEISPRPTDPAALARDAVQAIAAAAARRNVSVHLALPEGLPAVLADGRRMLQVFSNVLGNALEVTSPGGSLTVEAEPLEREILFMVTDTGSGIARADLPHVFDRSCHARTASGGGAWLGLAIARGIVERHGGRIGVESTEGVGSTFFFTLPIAADGAPAPSGQMVAEEPPHPARAANGRPARVLLVDDHPLMRRAIQAQLARDGRFEVAAEVGTAEAALQMLELVRPDVVVMDLDLPGMSGVEAIRRIAARPHPPRVIALTAGTEDDLLVPVLQAGGCGFVRKPVAHEDLIPALETVLRDEVFLHPAGNRMLLRDVFHRAHPSPDETAPLSDSERRVLALCAEGYNSAEIGKRLFLSRRTVDTYRSRAMRKVGLASRAEVVRFAIRNGLIGRTEAGG
jgi:DNA-binding NarL/FixJ family response regulator